MEEVYAEFRKQCAAAPRCNILAHLEAFLGTCPEVNQPDDNDDQRWCLLAYACRLNFPSVVSLLLRIPGVDVNMAVAWSGWTPLFIAVHNEHITCVKLLLENSRVDIEIQPRSRGKTLRSSAFRHAANRGYAEGVKCFLALRDLEEMLPLAKNWADMGRQVHQVCHAYVLAPRKTHHDLRVTFSVPNALAGERFASVLLLADGHFVIAERFRNFRWDGDIDFADQFCDYLDGAVRFLLISQRLPLELQMVLTWRSLGLARDTVLRRDFDPAILSLLS